MHTTGKNLLANLKGWLQAKPELPALLNADFHDASSTSQILAITSGSQPTDGQPHRAG